MPGLLSCQRFTISITLALGLLLLPVPAQSQTFAGDTIKQVQREPGKMPLVSHSFFRQLALHAAERIHLSVAYDPSYRKIPYPGGDVPDNTGVCTDLIVRAYRKLNVDLQVLVHEDMKAAFHAYPRQWGLSAPDANIDHRRVLNLVTFFSRHGETLPVSHHGEDYAPGDIVSWQLPDNRPHIGIVSTIPNGSGSRYLIIHNIGNGPRSEDVLFKWTVRGHFRFKPASSESAIE